MSESAYYEALELLDWTRLHESEERESWGGSNR